jgi:capsular polysaccharide export protein
MSTGKTDKAPDQRQTLFAFNLGLLFFKRARRILEAHGFTIKLGIPKSDDDMIAVWGRKKTSLRGRKIAQRRGVGLVTVEDSFLRSVRTGRQGAPSLGVVLDRSGIFFDATQNNDLNVLIRQASGIGQAEFDQAREGIEILKSANLSKYNGFELDDADLPTDYVLVVDQTVGDASVTLGGADSRSFERMLRCAMSENPGVKILIKAHPETVAGKRLGHFRGGKTKGLIQIYDQPVSPWRLMKSAHKVYCVTSQLGMEAIFAGHRPVVFGMPFYAGWGLSDDRHPDMRQKGWRNPEHLFWAAYLKYSLWYDPYFKRASNFFNTANVLAAKARQWRDGSQGALVVGMRLWKRGFMRRNLAMAKRQIIFARNPKDAVNRADWLSLPMYAWGQSGAGLAAHRELIRVEDGFVRSQGLGANLVPPCSLVYDRVGIYYDPRQPSELELLIEQSLDLNARAIDRAQRLRADYCRAGISKYNLGGAVPKIANRTGQQVVLVVGQVEDDASVQLGCCDVRTNEQLVWAVRQTFPKAYLIYKPHPDVEAGLRSGSVAREILRATADIIADEANIAELIKQCDTLCTMTSLAGFEALLYGKKVVCFGAPFYAGWGLTDDRGMTVERRVARPSLDQLTHACLVDYPRYWDPVSGEACPPETVFERFSNGEYGPQGTAFTKVLAKLQGVFASYAHLWR